MGQFAKALARVPQLRRRRSRSRPLPQIGGVLREALENASSILVARSHSGREGSVKVGTGMREGEWSLGSSTAGSSSSESELGRPSPCLVATSDPELRQDR